MSNWLGTGLGRGAVLGAALVGLVGAAGLALYERMYAEERRAMLVKDMARLDQQVMSMREELEALRELQKETQLKRVKRRVRPRPAVKVAATGDQADGAVSISYASDSEYLTDYQSIAGTDGEMDSESEFYDVHSDSEREDSVASDQEGRTRLSNGTRAATAKVDDLELDDEILLTNGTKHT